MRLVLLATLLMVTGAANATTWMDVSCAVGLSSEPGGTFQFIDGEKEQPTTACKLTKAQELTCADGQKREMVALPDNQVMVDGVRLFAVGDKNPEICD